ncbi:hypothetical protein QJR26_18145 (plasmid) [Clostridium baratii]
MAKNKEKYYFYDKRTGTRIDYIKYETLKEKYPDGDYHSVGEITTKEKNENGITKKLLNEDLDILVQPIGTYKESKYKTLGYIPCENNEYVILKKKKGLLGWILLLLLIAVTLSSGFFIINKNKSDIDPKAGDYSSALKRPENIDDSKILVPSYRKFTIKKGSDTIDTAFFNPEGNPCFFKFTLIEKSTNEVLYESKLVPPGKGITPIQINKTFDKVGEYDAILKFQSFDLEDKKIEYNGSNIAVKLNIVD